MASSMNINNGVLTINFQYQAPTDVGTEILLKASKAIFDRSIFEPVVPPTGPEDPVPVPREFDDLSNNEKLGLVDEYLRETIINLARHERVQAAQIAARKQAETENVNIDLS